MKFSLSFLGLNPMVSRFQHLCSTSKAKMEKKGKTPVPAAADSSSPTFICEICRDPKLKIEAFEVVGCDHSCCSDCVSVYLAEKLQEGEITRITCPVLGCGNGVIQPENCSLILPKNVFDRWGDALLEATILGFDKLGCPFEDCCAVLIDEKIEVRESECPVCRRLFCAKCMVPWHSGISCSEFRRLQGNGEDLSESEDESEKFMCDICCDEKEIVEIFTINGCDHTYCCECVSKYVAAKLEDNVSRIACPVSGCFGVVEPVHCHSFLPKNVFDHWVDALCEATILNSEKFYCPFKDCSALLVDEKVEDVVQSECPECKRLFCAKCKVPWHSDISCVNFQKLHKNDRQKEDIQLINLAAGKEWRKCPNCGMYVEKIDGCRFMYCRCKCTFCYKCGIAAKDHNCPNCGKITRNMT